MLYYTPASRIGLMAVDHGAVFHVKLNAHIICVLYMHEQAVRLLKQIIRYVYNNND